MGDHHAVDPGVRGRTGRATTLSFGVAPPRDVVAGTYWALVKVMYFGRMHYSASVPVTILASNTAGVLDLAAGR